MRVPSKQNAIDQAALKLSEILSIPAAEVEDRIEEYDKDPSCADAILSTGSHLFHIWWLSSGTLGRVAQKVSHVKIMERSLPDSHILVLAVPYMSPSAADHCEKEGLAWIDLSGNAKIVAPGLYVHIFGHKNLYRRPGRPESAFGPRGSRVARWLLMNSDDTVLQRSLASFVGLDEGHVSRVVGKLIEMGLVQRGAQGIQVTDADRLLHVWRDEYRFQRHTIIRGHITASPRKRVDQVVAQTMSEIDRQYAITGLSAAWRLTRWAGYRLTTIYLDAFPTPILLDRIGFREESRGANTWLVLPNDTGVFDGSSPVDGVQCVHPVQVYLDLKGHPERASEAAEELRIRLLS